MFAQGAQYRGELPERVGQPDCGVHSFPDFSTYTMFHFIWCLYYILLYYFKVQFLLEWRELNMVYLFDPGILFMQNACFKAMRLF